MKLPELKNKPDFERSLERIYAWFEGEVLDQPIMQWLPLLRRIRGAGKSLVIDLQFAELEPFMEAMRPEGILLCIAADSSLQPDIVRRLERWS